MKKIISLIVVLFTLSTIINAQVVINEYSASNSSILADYQGDFEDYIELYNGGGSAVNLAGYYLSDNGADPTQWVFPAGINIAPNGRLLIYASGKDLITGGGQIHTNFKLTQCHNNQIIFSNTTGVIIDSLTLIRTQNNHSRGRVTDGSATFGLFTTPSPSGPNGGSFVDYATRPIFSVAPGFYTATQNVALSTTQANITIRYTIDGQVPTATSTIYTTPIVVAANTVIRAVAFSSDPTIRPSFTETNTYLLNVTHPTWFNVISVAGRFTIANGGGSLFGAGQDVRSSVEFFDSAHNFRWEYEGEARRHGHDSWAYPQKGFRIACQDEFGYMAEMPEKFFASSSRDSFKLVILKAAASDNYPGNTGNPGAHLRDAYCHTYSIKANMEFDERNYAPTVVYVNGQYWGIYEIRERVDLDYVKYYYDQPKTKVDMIRYWGGTIIDAGSDTGWVNLKNFINGNNMAIAANYNYVESVLNTNSLIDFFVYNNYLANSDHMNWNTMWWRGRKGSGVKWHYALWDQDNIFDLGENFTGLSTTGPDLDPCEPFTLFNNSNSIFHTQIINGLMTNPTFKKKYLDRYAMWLSTYLTCDSLLAHLNKFEAIIGPEMGQHTARWGGSVPVWQNHVDSIRSFILQRCQLVGSSLDTCGPVQKIVLNVDAVGMGKIKFKSNVINSYPYKQVCNADSIYEIEAIPNPGYVFSNWLVFKSQNVITPTMQSAVAFLDYRKEDSIVAVFKIRPLDTFNIVITALPTWAGTITLDGTTVLNASNFPYILKAIEKTSHTLLATPDTEHRFNSWTQQTTGNINPVVGSYLDAQISFTANANDMFTAKFDTLIKVGKNVYVPNAFSPNKDGRNDYFGVDASQNEFIVSVDMQVFDRFGERVYKGNGMNTGWDGKNKGVPAELGTYFYSMSIKFTDGKTKLFKGDVLLVN